MHSIEHIQLHLIFCTNNTVNTNSMHHCKSGIKAMHTSISLENTVYYVYIMEMCVLYIVYNCLLCKCVQCVKCVYCCLYIVNCSYLVAFTAMAQRVLYQRIWPSVHLCAWCVTIKRFDLILIDVWWICWPCKNCILFLFFYTGTMHNKSVVPKLTIKLICICSPWAGCCYNITIFNQKQYNTYNTYNITSYSI